VFPVIVTWVPDCDFLAKGIFMPVLFQRWFVAVVVAAGLAITPQHPVAWGGVYQEEDHDTATVTAVQDEDESEDFQNEKPQPKSAGFEFEKPFRVEADGQAIAVESPGYASPTMADVDGDGVPDLVVGQFREGNLQFFKNLAGKNEAPRFAASEWLMTDGKRAMVPGVW